MLPTRRCGCRPAAEVPSPKPARACPRRESVGGFCCPAPPVPRYVSCSLSREGYQAALAARATLSLASLDWPDNGGTMPGELRTFPRTSILIRPPRAAAPTTETVEEGSGELVEAPGSAPGSVTAIAYALYRHSRFPDTPNIGSFIPPGKGPDRATAPFEATQPAETPIKRAALRSAARVQQGGVNDPGQGPGGQPAEGGRNSAGCPVSNVVLRS